MNRLLAVCEVVLPVVVFILVGVVGRRRNWFSAEGVADMKWIAINVCIPAVLFRAFYTMDFGLPEAAALITMALSTLVCFGFGIIVSRALDVDESISAYLCTTIEGGGVGYPFYILLFGAATELCLWRLLRKRARGGLYCRNTCPLHAHMHCWLCSACVVCYLKAATSRSALLLP